MNFFVAFLVCIPYDELMKDKNNETLEQVIAARNVRIMEANRKAAEIAKKNLSLDPLRA